MEREKLIALVGATQKGEEAAFTELYESFQSDIYYHILKNVDNDPELAADLTQETFIEIMQHIGDLKEPAAFVTWSQRIAYHQCTAYFRKQRELLADENDDGFSVFDTIEEDRTEFIPGEALDKEELKLAILNMINSLPPEQRSAIMLRYFNEVSVKEIADIQGVSEGTVKSRLNYGRKAIKDEVEKYEKKNNIKLHCAGVIPLFLWLLRELKRTSNIPLTATLPITATEATVAAAGVATATTAAVTSAAATSTASAITGGFLSKNVVAIAIAASLIIGGTTAGILLRPEQTDPATPTITTAPSTSTPSIETKPSESIAPTTVPVSQPVSWYGYGTDAKSTTLRFDLTTEEMDDNHIRGQLAVSRLYQNTHVTAFEGTGVVVDNKIRYDITFEVSAFASTVGSDDEYYSKITAIYDPQTDTLSFVSNAYDVCMTRSATASLPALFVNERWSGIGKDSVDLGYHADGHLFELEIYEMTEAEICGKLTVSKDGIVEHVSEFSGRGYRSGDTLRYEICLDTPRNRGSITTFNIDYFWFYYYMEEDAFKFASTYYSAKMTRENENS